MCASSPPHHTAKGPFAAPFEMHTALITQHAAKYVRQQFPPDLWEVTLIATGYAVLSWRYLCPRALGWTMSHMISSRRNPGLSAMMGLNMAFRYEMLCMAKRGCQCTLHA